MPRIVSTALLVILLTAVLIGSVAWSSRPDTTVSLAGTTIALDPGHGGVEWGVYFEFDDGAIVYEKDVNLAVALALREALQKDGVRVVLTRADDSFVSLDERVALADESDAQVLVSIHHNAANDPRVDWTETYFSQPEDRVVAEALFNALVSAFLMRGGGARHSPDFVLTDRPKMPSTLTEAYFLTHPAEARNFRDVPTDRYASLPRVQTEAMALRDGLFAYFQGQRAARIR